jgi:cell wall-associated NlpC family hydrolase
MQSGGNSREDAVGSTDPRLSGLIRAFIAAGVAAAVIGTASPAVAAPGITQPPSTGSRPAPSGSLSLPGAGTSTAIANTIPAIPAIPTDPVLAQINQQDAAAESLSERLNDDNEEIATRTASHNALAAELARVKVTLDTDRVKADEWVRSAYMEQAGRPDAIPLEPKRTDDPALLGLLPPDELGRTPLTALAAAQHSFDDAQKLDAEAALALRLVQQHRDQLQAQLTQTTAAAQVLRTQNAAAIAAAEKKRDEEAAAVSAQFLKDAAGQAHPKALEAVAWALKQKGKPYHWGDEGPDFFDCSGLVQAAYGHAGISLPRTARPQYRATKEVAISGLMPGDLLFFATNKSDWNTIHHVAIYLGHGEMLHAPKSGDVVKISPIWWAEFYRATRVIDPLPQQPAPKPTTSPDPKPGNTPTPPSSPKPNPDPKPDPSPDPKPTASATPPSSPTPDPTCTPPPSPSPSPSTVEVQPTGTPSSSGEPTPTGPGTISPSGGLVAPMAVSSLPSCT